MDQEVLEHRDDLGGSTIYFTSDLTVASNQTWHFFDSTVKFSSGKKLKVYGTLEADETTFTASGSSWDGIYFYSSSTGDITESAIVEVSSGAALYAYNVSSVIIDNTEIENTKSSSYSMAVWAFGNNGTVELYGNTIRADGGPTLLFQDGVEGFLFSNIILMDGSTDGTVYVEGNEVKFAEENGDDGSNVVKGGPGLYAYGDGILNAGFSSGDMDNNSMCSNIGLTAENGGVLYAHYNKWWGGVIPVPVKINGGDVWAANSTGWSNPTCFGASAMARVAHAAPSLSTLAAVAFTDAPATEPSNAEEDLAAKTLVAQRRYEEAVRLFQQILTDYPKDPAAHAALLELRLVHKRAGDAGARSVLASLASAPGPHRASALGALAALDARAGKDTDAFARVDALAALHPDSYQAFSARLTAFHVHLSRKHYEAALAILDGMPARSAGEQRALLLAYRAYTIESGQAVSRTFVQEAAWHQPTAEAVRTEAGERAGSEVAVMAYPNPFNPSTTLRYELPVEAHVRLAVYDLLGRVVATLVDGPQQAGSYAVAFEASHLPSGTYVYRLEAEAAVYTGVLLLLK